MNEVILSNMLGCQTYCISDSPSNRYCLIGPIECNEKLIEVFKKGITVKLKYVEKRVLDAFTDNGIDLCMTFERYVEIADKDAERAMAFLKEVYPFNEETEVFIRKRYNMSIGVDPEEN